jgi:RNA polymerase sigma-70 factor (ECF subfamily)
MTMNAIRARSCDDELDALRERRAATAGAAPWSPSPPFDLARAAQLNGDALYRLAHRLTGDREAARDLLHDTYERALCSRPAEVPDDKAKGWLSVIMRNMFYDQWRSKRRHLEVDLEEIVQRHAASELEEEPDWARVSVEHVRGCLEELAAPLRTVYELHTFAGLSYNEISSSLRVPARTVGTRLFRARQKLRRALERHLDCPAT